MHVIGRMWQGFIQITRKSALKKVKTLFKLERLESYALDDKDLLMVVVNGTKMKPQDKTVSTGMTDSEIFKEME